MRTKISGSLVLFSVTAILGATYIGCSHFPKFRAPSSEEPGAPSQPVSEELLKVLQQDVAVHGGNIHFPPGLSVDETIDLWHLSEGSDIFPLKWIFTMRSQFSSQAGKTNLIENLDQKFGVVKESAAIAARSPYPLKWVGLSASWSGEHPTRADVRLRPDQSVEAAFGVRGLPNRGESIAMVGVNCSFCHSNEIQFKDKRVFYEGAPNMLNIRGFFQDLFASTAKTMLTPEILDPFLRANGVGGDTKAMAVEFSASLKRDLGLDSVKQRVVGHVLNFLDQPFYEGKKVQTLRKQLFARRDVLQSYLAKLVQLTMGVNELSPELQQRMMFLAASMGLDPKLPTTPEGFARTDAFGRISNWVARSKNPIPLTATSSVPPMWNIKYRALFHWNANTNSVVMRNLGQSFGLGAVMTNTNGEGAAKYDTTANLHNLVHLENLLYKVQSPDWASTGEPLDLARVKRGCEVFNQTCARCHQPKSERVGPQKSLVEYNLLPQKVIGTDTTYLTNQATPVDGVPFKEALFKFTQNIRDRYYQRYQIFSSQQKEWERFDLRGPELFRDTSLGEDGHTGVSVYLNIPTEPAPGYPARSLGGIWATPPYLHNGSVANLEELLKPSSERAKIFFVGSRVYDPETLGFKSGFTENFHPIPDLDKRAQVLMKSNLKKILDDDLDVLTYFLEPRTPRPRTLEEARIQVACTLYPEHCFNSSQVGNSNVGHEGVKFGTYLPAEDKRSVIEFLKVLRTDPEYSHNTPPIYSSDGQTCEIVNTL